MRYHPRILSETSYIDTEEFKEANPFFAVEQETLHDEYILDNICVKTEANIHINGTRQNDPNYLLSHRKLYTIEEVTTACGDNADYCLFDEIMAKYGFVLNTRRGYLIKINSISTPRYNEWRYFNNHINDSLSQAIYERSPGISDFEHNNIRRHLRDSILRMYSQILEPFATRDYMSRVHVMVKDCTDPFNCIAGPALNHRMMVGPLMEPDLMLPLYRCSMCRICLKAIGHSTNLGRHLREHTNYFARKGIDRPTNEEFFEPALCHHISKTYIAVRLSLNVRRTLFERSDDDIIRHRAPVTEDSMLEKKIPQIFENSVSGIDGSYYLEWGLTANPLCNSMREVIRTALLNRFVSEPKSYRGFCVHNGLSVAKLKYLKFYKGSAEMGTVESTADTTNPHEYNINRQYFRPLTSYKSCQSYSLQISAVAMILLMGVNACLDDPVLDMPAFVTGSPNNGADLHHFSFTRGELEDGKILLRKLKHIAADMNTETDQAFPVIGVDVANRNLHSEISINSTPADLNEFYETYRANFSILDDIYDKVISLLYVVASGSGVKRRSVVQAEMDRQDVSYWTIPIVAAFLLSVCKRPAQGSMTTSMYSEEPVKFMDFTKRSALLSMNIFAMRLSFLHTFCVTCTRNGTFSDWLERTTVGAEDMNDLFVDREQMKNMNARFISQLLKDVNETSMSDIVKQIYYPTLKSKRAVTGRANPANGVFFPKENEQYMMYPVHRNARAAIGSRYRSFGRHDVHIWLDKCAKIVQRNLVAFCRQIKFPAQALRGLIKTVHKYERDFQHSKTQRDGSYLDQILNGRWQRSIFEFMLEKHIVEWNRIMLDCFKTMNYAIMAYISLSGYPMRGEEFRDLNLDIGSSGTNVRDVFGYKNEGNKKILSVLFISRRHKSTRAPNENVMHWIVDRNICSLFSTVLGPVRYCYIKFNGNGNHNRAFMSIKPGGQIAKDVVSSIHLPMGYRQLRNVMCQMYTNFVQMVHKESVASGDAQMLYLTHVMSGHTMRTYNLSYDNSRSSLDNVMNDYMMKYTIILSKKWLQYVKDAPPTPHQGEAFSLSPEDTENILQQAASSTRESTAESQSVEGSTVDIGDTIPGNYGEETDTSTFEVS